jgi:hypothetical protein
MSFNHVIFICIFYNAGKNRILYLFYYIYIYIYIYIYMYVRITCSKNICQLYRPILKKIKIKNSIQLKEILDSLCN